MAAEQKEQVKGGGEKSCSAKGQEAVQQVLIG